MDNLLERIREITASLPDGTTICPGMLAKRALDAEGIRLPARTNRLRMVRPLLDELRAEGALVFKQRGKVVPKRVAQLSGPFRVGKKPNASPRRFNYDLDFSSVDFREHPELYRVGIGEQGVLLVEPYKSEILPHWRFKNPEVARKSAAAIYRLFRGYVAAKDFVGMDMARKFLQMGFTRARRYANHATGRKYDRASGKTLPQDKDALSGEKAEAARIFYEYYVRARELPAYRREKKRHQALYG